MSLPSPSPLRSPTKPPGASGSPQGPPIRRDYSDPDAGYEFLGMPHVNFTSIIINGSKMVVSCSSRRILQGLRRRLQSRPPKRRRPKRISLRPRTRSPTRRKPKQRIGHRILLRAVPPTRTELRAHTASSPIRVSIRSHQFYTELVAGSILHDGSRRIYLDAVRTVLRIAQHGGCAVRHVAGYAVRSARSSYAPNTTGRAVV
ncbi:uncharacterized protein EI97DRAFT_444821 [Westerdykella ornata]|uniref:Uncharacterized protein n=1 Tax=Westerdykella ornata TaxID=318751 RepID=A0A6A6JBG4_WESOR|nr:uncharacterized protein EI97DRAFT_444821 [Westerdykella ornata]KAF2273523.1 hypothetical protein EI97DRAFT_444821 [Westerdykella ornata]